MNAGKKFEQAIKKSVDTERVVYHRLPDSTGTFSGGSQLRYSAKQPCDLFLFDTEMRTFYALELKSTKGKSISFEDINLKEQPSRMIHKHQILSLRDFGEYQYVVSGFIFNFRDEENGIETTYFQSISDFIQMTDNIGKKSFNQNDLSKYNPQLIEGAKKRVNWTWNIAKFLNDNGG